MRILVITQVYFPDTVSVAQHLSDLCVKLDSMGHQVFVVSSSHAYDDNSIVFPKRERQGNIQIKRLNNTSFGKKTILGRLMDFASFNLLCLWRLLQVSKSDYDLILGLTSPPLISYFGSWIAKMKKIKFAYWVMDLQPELAIASDMIGKNSLPAKVFTFMGNATFKRADRTIALDSYMVKYAYSRGAKQDSVFPAKVWPPISLKYEGDRNSNPFRLEHGFGDKIVLMYSGNNTSLHPLDTIVEAAIRLKNDPRFLFVFIGGGTGKKAVTEKKEKHHLENLIQLPFQPREYIHISLAAADIQLVTMGNGLVGYTHPNKIYGAMYVGRPIVYVGPKESHVGEIFEEAAGNCQVEHGEVDKLVEQLLHWGENRRELIETGSSNFNYAEVNFNPELLLEKTATLIDELKEA